jgi:hypothetical protein
MASTAALKRTPLVVRVGPEADVLISFDYRVLATFKLIAG